MTEDEAKLQLSSHLQPIRGFFTKAFDRYMTEYQESARADHDPSIMAQCLHGHVRTEASKYAAQFPDSEVFFSKHRNMYYLLIDGHIAIRFKKLDGKLRPSNNETHQSLDYRSDEEVEGLAAKVKLDAGYTVSPLGDTVSSVHLIRWCSPNKWHWELQILEKDVKGTVTPMFEIPEYDDEMPSEIKGKPSDVIPFKPRKADKNDDE